MGGALSWLKAILADNGKDAVRAARNIGDGFMGAAQDVPEMFIRGNKFALTDPGLEQQFGLRIDRGLGADGAFIQGTGARNPPSVNTLSIPDLARENWFAPNLSNEDLGYLPAHSRIMEADTSGLSSDGAGKATYGTMYGMLSNEPRWINATSRLSGRNAYRRNYNQAAALMRDPSLSKRLLVDPDQLRVSGIDQRPMDFRNYAPEEQVGRLQAEGALETMRRLEKLRAHPETYDHMRPRIHDMMTNLIPYSDDVGDFSRAAQALRSSGAPKDIYDTIGPSALRRAALVNDFMGGDPLRSSPIRWDLFRRLEYRHGGPVPRGA